MCGNHGCRRSWTKAQLSKNVVFLLKTVLLAGWEFALRMIPAGLLRLVALRIQRSPRSRRGSLRAHSILHPVTSKTTVLLTCSVLRPHSRVPCAMPSNPGHVIDLCGYASRCIAMLTKHNHSVLYELFGGVINQLTLTTSHQCAHMPQPGIFAEHKG